MRRRAREMIPIDRLKIVILSVLGIMALSIVSAVIIEIAPSINNWLCSLRTSIGFAVGAPLVLLLISFVVLGSFAVSMCMFGIWVGISGQECDTEKQLGGNP
jgi:hypothetical protein